MKDIYEALAQMAETYDYVQYYRCSKTPDMAAWDFEITQDRFNRFSPNEKGFVKVVYEFSTPEDAKEAVDHIPVILRKRGLDRFKCVFGYKDNYVGVVFNCIADDGEEFTDQDEAPFCVYLKKFRELGEGCK